jgi:hypothetical protein
MLMTSNKEAIAANALRLSSTAFQAQVAAELGTDWVWLTGQDAQVWLVHADSGFLMYVSQGALYTDVEVNTDVQALAQVARALSWPGARGVSPEGHVTTFQRALGNVGIRVALKLFPSGEGRAVSGGVRSAAPKA